MSRIQHFPTEVLTLILRLATSLPEIDKVSLNLALSPAIYLSARPKELRANLQIKAAISRVCRRWNVISAPFLCEFVSLNDKEHLDGLVTCLEKEDEGYKGKRTRWITHLDMRITELDHSPHPRFITFGSIASLSFQIKRANFSDLKRLSTLCPRLEHLAMSVIAKVDESVSIEDFAISFPHIRSLILEWLQSVGTLETTFQSWDLPKLYHFGFYLRGTWVQGLVLQILGNAANTLKSLDICDFGRRSITIRNDFFPSFPLLETLILDPMIIALPLPHHFPMDQQAPNLTTLRCRMISHLGWQREIYANTEYFKPPRFPSLKVAYMVYPQDFLNSPMNDTLNQLYGFVRDNDWVPIFTLANERLSTDLLKRHFEF